MTFRQFFEALGDDCGHTIVTPAGDEPHVFFTPRFSIMEEPESGKWPVWTELLMEEPVLEGTMHDGKPEFHWNINFMRLPGHSPLSFQDIFLRAQAALKNNVPAGKEVLPEFHESLTRQDLVNLPVMLWIRDSECAFTRVHMEKGDTGWSDRIQLFDVEIFNTSIDQPKMKYE